jgi:hypothetical protein
MSKPLMAAGRWTLVCIIVRNLPHRSANVQGRERYHTGCDTSLSAL